MSKTNNNLKMYINDEGKRVLRITYRLSCKKQMREMLERGDVVMVYSEQYKIPTSLPYVVQSGSFPGCFV